MDLAERETTLRKQKIRKKCERVFLALALWLAVLFIPAQAAKARVGELFDDDNFHYQVTAESDTEKTVILFKLTGHTYSGSILIPDSVEHDGKVYQVTCLGNTIFMDSTGLTSVVIPDSVTEIRNSAFNGCSNLTSVTLPANLTEIQGSTFNGCSKLTDITIPDKVKIIGGHAFYNCGALTDITIPDGVTTIGEGAFQKCTALTNIVIPGSVTSIGKEAFNQCSELETVKISNGVEEIGESAFSSCKKLTDVKIPDSVTSIGDSAFSSCYKLENIKIPNGITEIGKTLFSNCGITDIEIPDSVTSIGERAFYNCSALTDIKIPEGVETIGVKAFMHCDNIKSIEIPASVRDIGNQAFYNIATNASVDSLVIVCKRVNAPDIGSNVFGLVPETKINLFVPNGANGYETANGWPVKGVAEYEYTTVGPNAYITQYNGLSEDVEIPETLEGKTVKGINANAFLDKTQISHIVIPASVETIGDNAFEGLGKMIGSSKTLTIECKRMTAPTLETNVFYDCHDDVVLLIPTGASGYEYIKGWPVDGTAEWVGVKDSDGIFWITQYNGTQTVVEVPGTINGETVTGIEEELFKKNTEITEVVLPSGIKKIGAKAFYGCENLKKINLPEGLEFIGEEAFVETVLEKVELPASLKCIEDFAFQYLYGLEEIVFPEEGEITNLGNGIFGDNSGLVSVTIPKNMKVIGNAMFDGSVDLTEVVIEDGVESIGIAALRNCPKLKKVSIPTSVKSIGDNDFECDEALEELTIPEGVETISYMCFGGCTALKTLTLPSTVTKIEDWAFSGGVKGAEIKLQATVAPELDGAYIFNAGANNIICVPVDATGYDTGDWAAYTASNAVKIQYHTHTYKTFPRVEPSCTETGHEVYYQCTDTDCLKYFRAMNSDSVIPDIEDWLASEPPTGGKLLAPGHAGGHATLTTKRICDNCGEPYGDFLKEPVVLTPPTVSPVTYHPTKKVQSCELLTTGALVKAGENTVSGTWEWKESEKTKVLTVDNVGYTAFFTPVDLENYVSVETTVAVTVNQAVPYITATPTVTITYGPEIGDDISFLPPEVQYSETDTTKVGGYFDWSESDKGKLPTVADSGVTEYTVVFYPTDAVNYAPAEKKLKITVNKQTNAPKMPVGIMDNVPNSQETTGDVPLPENWAWEDETIVLPAGVATMATAKYIGADAENYENTSVVIYITRSICAHSEYDEVSEEATCTTDGYTKKKCKSCGAEFDYETIPAKGHTFDEETWESNDSKHWHPATCGHDEKKNEASHTESAWITVQEAQEGVPGKKHIECMICKREIETAEIEALPHKDSAVKTDKVEPDCITAGAKAYWTCQCGKHFSDSACENEISGDIEDWLAEGGDGYLAPTGVHTWSETREPLDPDDGKHYQKCTVCGQTGTGTAHTWNVEKPDEENDQHCKICGYINAPKHTHSVTLQSGKEPTCTETGLRAYYSCDCGKNFEDEAFTKPITEDIDSWKVIPAKGHSFDTDKWEADDTKHWNPATCGHTGEHGSEAAHVAGEWITDQAATEAEAGKRHKECTICKRTLETEVMEALPHKTSAVKMDAVEPTCEEYGAKAYWKCACGKYFEDAECTIEIKEDINSWKRIAKTAHTPGPDPTESTPQTCTVCGEQLKPALGHTHTGAKVEGTPADCTTDGTKEYYSCDCGWKFKDAACTEKIEDFDIWVVIPATGHTFSTEWSTDEDGHWHAATCAHTSEKKDAGTHTFDADNVCTTCGYKKVIGHTHTGTKVDAAAADCTTPGTKEYYTCDCGEYFEDAACTKKIENIEEWKVVPATGHTFDTKWSTDADGHWHAATCAHTGEKKDAGAHTFNADNVCTACGYKKTAAHTHAGTKVEGKAATCTANGAKAYYTCTCGKYFEDAACTKEIANIDTWKVVPATGHTFDTKWSSDANGHWHAATCAHTTEKKDAGAHTFGADNACTVCGYKKTAAHTHAGTKVDGKAATCTADGAKEYYTCTCGKCFEDAACTKEIADADTWKVIKAEGHKETDVALTPATQTADGKTAGKVCSVCGETLSGCETIYKASTVALAQSSFVYDGKAKTPKMNVKDSQGKAIAAANYTLKLDKGRKNVGQYKVTLTFKGSYSGSKNLSFTIVPKGTGVSKVAADKKSLKITLKKQTKQTSGYEIQVSPDKGFKKNVKKATLKDPKKNVATVKGLKSKTKYYIRVRTYKTVKNKKFYSDWKQYGKAVTTKK